MNYNDYLTDYIPDETELIDWLTDDPTTALEQISTYPNGLGIISAAWLDKNETKILEQYETQKHETDPDRNHDERQ